jgi:hypothetical protein
VRVQAGRVDRLLSGCGFRVLDRNNSDTAMEMDVSRAEGCNYEYSARVVAL